MANYVFSIVNHSLSYCIIYMTTQHSLHLEHMTAYVSKSCPLPSISLCSLVRFLLFLPFSYNCYLFVINFATFSLDFIVVAVAVFAAAAGEHSM